MSPLLNTAFPVAVTIEQDSFLGTPKAQGQLSGQTDICIFNGLVC